MTGRKPPALARWLLTRYADPPLTGDLLEEFHSGRSRAWFWRQSLAVVVSTRTGAARGIFIGWLTQLPIILALWAIDIPPRPIHPFAWATGVLVISCTEWLFANRRKVHRNGFWGSLLAMWFGLSSLRTPETLGRLAFYEAEVLLILLLGTLWMDTRRSPRLPLNK